MDWTVWTQIRDQSFPSCYFDFEPESTHVETGWKCDLYCGFDEIEETVLNVKSCIQVIRILLDKANDEALELEEDLITLQNQLIWTGKSWSRKSSDTPSAKIKSLDSFGRSLKNTESEDGHVFGVPLLAINVVVKECVPADLQPETDPIVDNQSLSCSTSESTKKEEKSTNSLVEKAVITGPQCDTGPIVDKKDLSCATSETKREEKGVDESVRMSLKESVTAGQDNKNDALMVEKLSPNCHTSDAMGKEEEVKESINVIVQESGIAGKQETNILLEKNDSSCSTETEIKEDEDKESIEEIVKESIINDPQRKTNLIVKEKSFRCSILETMVKEEKGEESEYAVTEDANSDASLVNDDPDKQKECKKFDLVANKKFGFFGHDSVSKERSSFFVWNSPWKPAEEGNHNRGMMKLLSAPRLDASEHAIGSNSKNELTDINANGVHNEDKSHGLVEKTVAQMPTTQNRETECDLSEKVECAGHISESLFSNLHDITEAAEKNSYINKDTEGNLTLAIDLPISPLKPKKKKTNTKRVQKAPGAGLFDTENHSSDSLLEFLKNVREQKANTSPEGQENKKPKVVDAKESDWNSVFKPQKPRAEKVLPQKPKVDNLSESQQKRKSQNSPGLEKAKKLKSFDSTLALPFNTTESFSVGSFCSTELAVTDAKMEETQEVLPPFSTVIGLKPRNLSMEKLKDLRAIAKLNNLKGYTKMKKVELAEKLTQLYA